MLDILILARNQTGFAESALLIVQLNVTLVSHCINAAREEREIDWFLRRFNVVEISMSFIFTHVNVVTLEDEARLRVLSAGVFPQETPDLVVNGLPRPLATVQLLWDEGHEKLIASLATETVHSLPPPHMPTVLYLIRALFHVPNYVHSY